MLLRASCFYTGTALAIIICCCSTLVLRCFGLYQTCFELIRVNCNVVLACLRMFCGLGHRVTGSIPEQPAVYACNHQSAWECFALMALLPRANFIIKRELLGIPFFGWGYSSIRPIAINRSARTAAYRQVMASAKEKLSLGESIVIFPEGTRTPPGQCGKMYDSYATIAAELGVPVVPVAHNSGWFWGRQEFAKRPGCIDLVFGEPIATEGKGRSQIAAETEAWIRQKVASLPSLPNTPAAPNEPPESPEQTGA